MLKTENIRVGDILRVVGYNEDSPIASRLKSIGLTPGTHFTIHRIAPLGDPLEIRFRGFSLGIRRHEVECLALDVAT